MNKKIGVIGFLLYATSNGLFAAPIQPKTTKIQLTANEAGGGWLILESNIPEQNDTSVRKAGYAELKLLDKDGNLRELLHWDRLVSANLLESKIKTTNNRWFELRTESDEYFEVTRFIRVWAASVDYAREINARTGDAEDICLVNDIDSKASWEYEDGGIRVAYWNNHRSEESQIREEFRYEIKGNLWARRKIK